MEMERDKREENVHEAGLAENHGNTLNSEIDLADHHEGADEPLEEEHVDYSNYSKVQLANVIRDLAKDDNFRRVDTIIREIKPLYDDIREKEKAEALMKFVAAGGTAEDFEYKGDESDIIFDANIKLIRDRKTNHLRLQEEKKNDNLRRKQELLEKIRVLADSQNSDEQFEQFKELQKEWKVIGPVPGTQAKTLWANYHALVDRFYDNQSIYFELKELDRRRNLESKLELCIRAEKLADVEIIKDAIRELNELHHEFKHIGPVPKDDKEVVWQRFKAASDAVYAKRDAYLQKLQQELHGNLDLKARLSDEVQEFSTFTSDRIKEWNQKTKEILDVQKKWEVIGGLPRAKAKEINKKFWGAFKTFFNNKNAFFKKLDEEREKNLQLKNELVEKALALKESHDWEKTSNELKVLQQKWKEVGPVPEKFREKVFKEFKDACDYFFDQRRTQHGKVENEQVENLRLKEDICTTLESHAAAGTASADILKELQDQFNAIGFVPRKDISAIRNRYHEAVDKFVGHIQGFSEDDKSKLLLENQLSDLKNDPMADRKIFQKEQAIRKKISKVENDIALWRNNLEFFSRSQNAESVRIEFNDKIREATEHLKQLKDQLKMLKTI
ncbi:MAG TPA: DUF349 domain-containing protein [Ohtaekwangia sp.]|uniref:DUF349 domain-containing protein n=1 Tax=Ohtaekwangia sp. TaxID=2066019 RepID=UPI002F94FE68